MVANVSPLSVLQNSPAPHQSSSASAGNGGPSFANMLNNEMNTHAASPPPPPAPPAPPASTSNTAQPSTPPASTPPANSTGTSSSAAGGTAGTASGGSAQVGKKTGKTGQTSTDAQTADAQAAASTAGAAAAAATAAALAAAASNPDLKKNATDNGTADASNAVIADSAATASSNAANSAANAAASAATAATGQFAALANNVAANAASGQARDTSAKAPFNISLASAADGKAPTTPLITQNAVAATSASLRGSAGKFSEQAPAELTALPNKEANPGAANTKAALEPAIPTAAPVQSLPAASGTALADMAIAAPIQNLKTAGQDLSIQQQNAIAPVLTAPVNLDTPAASSTIAPQVGSPAWDQAVGQKINWMVSGGQQTASLTLNPPDLGPMQVVLSVNNQHASATFISHQPEVRAALENAIPKLREMMEQSGIQLGQCNVNSQSQQQAFQQQSNSRSGSSATTEIGSAVSVMPSEPSAVTRTGLGLVDTFV